jgi:hypothetical protein
VNREDDPAGVAGGAHLPRTTRWPTAVPSTEVWWDTRLQAHHAVQLLASFAGEFLEARDDDGHRSLCWVPERAILATGSAERGDAPLTVTFDPAAFVLGTEVGVAGDSDTLELRDRTLADARRWLGDRIAEATGITPGLAPPEYGIPDHAVAGGATFAPDAGAAALLGDWFAVTADLLSPYAERAGARPLRCWPHHFDLATLTIVHPAFDGIPARTVGAGMTPGDEANRLPYGYVTPWPYPWLRPRPPLDFGFWHDDGWLGAVLPAERWLGEQGPMRAARFFEQAVGAAEALLSPP